MGATTIGSFVLAFLARRPLEPRWVRSATPIHQPPRQFWLEYVVVVGTGLFVMFFNRVAFGIPVSFGLRFFIGYVAAGFFLSLDMALARERRVIRETIQSDAVWLPPDRLYPMTRKFLAVALGVIALVVTILILVLSRDVIWLIEVGENHLVSPGYATWSVLKEIFFIMAVLLVMVVNLILSFSKNLRLLFDTETEVLERVTNGDLSRMVPVCTSDEFGAIAGYTNIMIEGLRHRIQLLSALRMAEAVQRNLLPESAPDFPGLDIAGTSLYCHEVGGDYFDFLNLPCGRLGVIVTDASGHGVGAALHMSTARAFLRFGSRRYIGPSHLLNDVNRYLTDDNRESGRFTTLFFLELDPVRKRFSWVRAGHEPALFFDAHGDLLAALDGKGVALGVVREAAYQEYTRTEWPSGGIILITTDGIRDARNPAGEMFGNERLQVVVRHHAGESARAIQDAIIAAVRDFQAGAEQEDDITLVVVKLR